MVSNDAKDLITKLLVVDPRKRITGAQALNHNWFKRFHEVKKGDQDDLLDPNILNQLK